MRPLPLLRTSTVFLFLVSSLTLFSGSLQATVITSGCANTNQSCSLNELVSGGTFIIDDKLFDSWFVNDFSSSPVNSAAIEVTALDNPPFNSGLQFNADAALSTVGFDLIDLTLGFTVSSLNGAALIKDNSLSLDTFTFGQTNTGGVIEIFEDVFDDTGNLIGDKAVEANNSDPTQSDLFDSVQFPPESEIFIETTILLSGDSETDAVSLSQFTQRFSQNQVPEPAVLMLVGIGLAVLRLSRKHRL